LRILIAFAAAATTLALVAAGPATATTRHVSVHGADAGDCADPAAPCRRPDYAIHQARAGDTVAFGAGEFRSRAARVRIDVPDLTITGQGAAHTYLVAEHNRLLTLGEHADGLTVRGVTLTGEATPLVHGLELADHVVVANVTLRDVAVSGHYPVFVPETAGIVHWTIDALHVAIAQVGVDLRGASANVTIRDSRFGTVGVGIRSVHPAAHGFSRVQRLRVLDTAFTGGETAIHVDGVDDASFSGLRISGMRNGLQLTAHGSRTRNVSVRDSRIDVTGVGVLATATAGGTFAGLTLAHVTYGATPHVAFEHHGVTGISVS
jgi:hypothetical protein